MTEINEITAKFSTRCQICNTNRAILSYPYLRNDVPRFCSKHCAEMAMLDMRATLFLVSLVFFIVVKVKKLNVGLLDTILLPILIAGLLTLLFSLYRIRSTNMDWIRLTYDERNYDETSLWFSDDV